MIFDLVGVLATACALVLLALAAVLIRRRLLERGGGTIECSMRSLSGQTPGPWRLGLARYQGDDLHWHRVFGIRTRPRQVFHRRGLVVSERREPTPEEAEALQPVTVIVELKDGDRTVEVAMTEAALTGFLAWLEAAPPGFPIDLPH